VAVGPVAQAIRAWPPLPTTASKGNHHPRRVSEWSLPYPQARHLDRPEPEARVGPDEQAKRAWPPLPTRAWARKHPRVVLRWSRPRPQTRHLERASTEVAHARSIRAWCPLPMIASEPTHFLSTSVSHSQAYDVALVCPYCRPVLPLDELDLHQRRTIHSALAHRSLDLVELCRERTAHAPLPDWLVTALLRRAAVLS